MVKKKTKRKRWPNETSSKVAGRISDERWAKWKQCAVARGMTFTAWLTEHLERAADREER